MIDIFYEIERLVRYGLYKNLIDENDIIYTRNRLLEVLKLEDFCERKVEEENLQSPETILNNIIKWAVDNKSLERETTESRDLFDTKIMGCLVPRPSEVIGKFYSIFDRSSEAATEYFYKLSKDSNYIRTERIKKDLKWKVETDYGRIDITINMSKPEKDPRDIAAQRNPQASSYPSCLLCRENEGYSGRVGHPARQNHRIIPITLDGEGWYFQYSPYLYYNEHCIVFKDRHEGMRLTERTFSRLLEFVEKFPHYFIGSNADLPIVGGSILSHDHFQGGRYEFAMASAKTMGQYALNNFKDVKLTRLLWPMSVLRLEGRDLGKVAEASNYIYERWKAYSDENVGIISHSGSTPHNTVTPIARMKEGYFQMDLVLRNNRTSEEYPEGIFHPNRELHHIKKENIGLIEVMGLAVLPGRLNRELNELEKYLLNRKNINETDFKGDLVKHKDWYFEMLEKHGEINENNVHEIIKGEVGLKFLRVLEDAGVFKMDKEGNGAFNRFINSL